MIDDDFFRLDKIVKRKEGKVLVCWKGLRPTEDGMKEKAIDGYLGPEQEPKPLITLFATDPAYKKALYTRTWDQVRS